MRPYGSTLELLARRLRSLRPSEQTAAATILRAPEKVALLPLKGLAAECGVSEATVLRLCRALGFNGWQDFKISLIPELLQSGGGLRPRVSDVEGIGASLAHNIQASLGALEEDRLREAARLIMNAGRISVVGLGGSGAVGYILAESLTSLGHLSAAYTDASFLQVLPEALGPEDLIVGISHSGETREVAVVLRRARGLGAGTIALTNYEGSEVDRAAEVTLFTSVPESILGSYSCEPRIVELAVVEALLAELGTGGDGA